LRVVLDSLPWQLVIVFIILVDAVFAIVDISVDSTSVSRRVRSVMHRCAAPSQRLN
jgi:hypothetical protein